MFQIIGKVTTSGVIWEKIWWKLRKSERKRDTETISCGLKSFKLFNDEGVCIV